MLNCGKIHRTLERSSTSAPSNGHSGHSFRNLRPGNPIQEERSRAVNCHHHRVQCVEEINERRDVDVDQVLQGMLALGMSRPLIHCCRRHQPFLG
jgi:hypothetical protein